MSDPKPEKKSEEPKSFGWMAEYEDENKLMDACRKVRDDGYTKTDAFTPFPVHGIDEALGIKPTVLPWFSFCAGALGTCTALLMQWYFNAVDYPYIISGKPFASWPAFIPVAFELTVLFAAFTTVFAMLGLNGLPKFSNPVFTNPKFDRATDDRFFLWIDASDEYYNSDNVRKLLAESGALEVEEVKEDDTPDQVPKGLILAILTAIGATLIPGMVILNMRNSKSGASRFHVFFDMDYQPKKKPQTRTTLFEDGRVQRPPVPGTVAFGELKLADPFYLGYEPEEGVASNAVSSAKFVSFSQDESTETADEAEAGEEAAQAEAALKLNWLKEFPEGVVTEEMFALGKNKFEQNCAACHGYSGYGDGLVSQRALSLQQGYWTQPTSLHSPTVQPQPPGQIYYTVANGKGRMGGYGASLNAKERWAVVLYVKALQRSQNANPGDVPEGVELKDATESGQAETAPAPNTPVEDEATESSEAAPAEGDSTERPTIENEETN